LDEWQNFILVSINRYERKHHCNLCNIPYFESIEALAGSSQLWAIHSRAGGGNMRPAGHIRPAKANFFSIGKGLFDRNLARETLTKAQCGPQM
jgi:hypothetical protein